MRNWTTLIAALACLLLVPSSATAGRMPTPPQVTVRDGECPYYAGRGERDVTCTDLSTGTVWLAYAASRFQLAHEVGHLFDLQVLTDRDREHLSRLLRIGGSWDQGTGMGTRGPSEVFADAYAACDLGMRPGATGELGMLVVSSWTTSYGYFPTARQHLRVCNAISWIGWWRARERSANDHGQALQ